MTALGMFVGAGQARLQDLGDLARRIEAAGGREVWHGQGMCSADPVAACAATMAASDELRCGVAAINIWTRTPAALAESAIALDSFGPGRASIAVSTWWDPAATRAGVARTRPVTALRECLHILRELGEHGRSTHAGTVFRTDGLAVEGSASLCAIRVAATGPSALAAGAELSDGVVLNYGQRASQVTETARQLRSIAGTRQFAVTALVWAAAGPSTPTRRRASDWLRAEQPDLVASLHASSGRRLSDDELVDAVAVVGDPADLRRGVASFAAAVDSVVLVPIDGSDPVTALTAVLDG